MRSREILGPTGPFARDVEGYEERVGQLDMAEAVERAIEEERALLCEAGTGTGKTLAYLVPAVSSGKKVVVSTATKALEEQIFHKDIPLVSEHMRVDPQAALVKGLGNYLCLRRFNEVRTSAAALTDPMITRSLPMIEAWAETTETGDVGELATLPENDPLWREVCSSSETRIGASCAYFDRCFVTKMKREMERARLLVVNHHLFFADLALRSASKGQGPRVGALPPYDVVIFDEAHQLEDIATNFFGTRISRARVDSMLRDAERAFVESGLALGKSKRKPSSNAQTALLASDQPTLLLKAIAEASEQLFSRVAALPVLSGEGRAALPADVWSGELLGAYHRLDSTLEALSSYAESHAINDVVRLVATRAEALQADAARIVDGEANQITWVEVRGRSVAVGASPIEIGRMFRDQVIDRVGAVVLTSATLTTGGRGDFRFLRSRLGIAGDADVEELSVESPFDYESASLLYLPTDLPEVSSAEFSAAAADRVAQLIATSGGGAFVLCTSTRAMNAFASLLRGRTPEPILVQGSAQKGTLLSRFRGSRRAVLVATMSFWEGVDVPGEALRLVIIDKIPFAVPSDPIVVARCDALEALGKHPFSSYSVPQAAITLKQGFGRLLRSGVDYGAVAILDRRIITKGYGKTLLGSLPPAPRTSRIDDVEAFYARRRT